MVVNLTLWFEAIQSFSLYKVVRWCARRMLSLFIKFYRIKQFVFTETLFYMTKTVNLTLTCSFAADFIYYTNSNICVQLNGLKYLMKLSTMTNKNYYDNIINSTKSY